jgi:hypothetical protein
MKKVISILIAALMSAASLAQVKVSHASVNPKMSELFDELTKLGRAPMVTKRGGMEQWDNPTQLEYTVRPWFRPDLWYSRQRKEEPLAQQLLAAIDSIALKFTNYQQDCFYQYNYGVTFGGFTPDILKCYASHIPETYSIQAQPAEHGFHFLFLETRGSEWVPLEFLKLKSFVNGKKTYFEGMAPKE